MAIKSSWKKTLTFIAGALELVDTCVKELPCRFIGGGTLLASPVAATPPGVRCWDARSGPDPIGACEDWREALRDCSKPEEDWCD